MNKDKIYTDLDEFLKVYDPVNINDSFTRKQIGSVLNNNGNLIFMPNQNEKGFNSYCSYGVDKCDGCGMKEDCVKLYKQFIREQKLKRILINGI